MTGNCRNQAREWGAGEGPADLEVAVAGCEVCPVLDGCVDRFAATISRSDQPTIAGLVVGGLHGRELSHAIKVARLRQWSAA